LGSHLVYTFSITRQVPSDLLFDVNLFGPTGNMIQGWRGGVNPVMTIYSRDGGIYYLQLTATNAATITGTETKPYMISLCSSLPLTRQAILPVVYGSASFPPPYSQVVRFSPRDDIGDVPLGYGGEAKSSMLVWEVNGARSLELEITAMHVGGIFQNCPAGDLTSVSPQDAVGRRKPLAVPSGSYPFSITGAGYYLFTIYVTKTDGSVTAIPRNVIVDCYKTQWAGRITLDVDTSTLLLHAPSDLLEALMQLSRVVTAVLDSIETLPKEVQLHVFVAHKK
jgi:hypothetical protein